MGTRGAYGFRIDGKDYLTYNHWDSYPTGMGAVLVEEIGGWNGNIEEMRALARHVRLIDRNTLPTDEQIKACAEYTDLGVNGQSTSDWYCLLRKAQGSLLAALDIGLMIDGHDFVRDSLFCEWAYIVNFDTGTFEVYRGFQKKKHRKGRFGRLKPLSHDVDGISEYYPIALYAEYPLDSIPEGWADQLEKQAAEEG